MGTIIRGIFPGQLFNIFDRLPTFSTLPAIDFTTYANPSPEHEGTWNKSGKSSQIIIICGERHKQKYSQQN
jgi:hypothetical protein